MFQLLYVSMIFLNPIMFSEPQQELDQILKLADKSIEDAVKVVEQGGLTPYKFGLSIGPDNPKAALRWFSALAERYKDQFDYDYGIAWVHYIQNDLTNAQKQASFLLSKGKGDNLTLARSRYLLGLIYINRGEYQSAKSEIATSFSLFNELGLNGGMFNCLLAQTDVEYLTGNVDAAVLSLEKAALINAKRSHPEDGYGWIEYKWGAIYLRKKSYDQAKFHFTKSLRFEDSATRHLVMMARTNLAICAIREGKSSEAFSYMREVDDFVKENDGNKLIFQYNNVAWVYYFHCQGQESRFLEVQIEDWLKNTSGNTELLGLLNVVKKISCE